MLKIIFIMLLFSQNTLSQTKLKISTVDNVITKICVGILREVFIDAKVEAKFIEQPSLLAIIDSNDGITGAEACRIYGADKEFNNLMPIGNNLTQFHAALVTKGKKYKKIVDKEGFKFRRIGIRSGDIFSNNITKGIDQNLIKIYRSTDDILEAVANEKIEIGLMVRNEVMQLVTKKPNEYAEIKFNNDNFREYKMYFYLNKKHQKLKNTISRSINAILKNGIPKQIEDKVLGPYKKALKSLQ